MIQVQVKKDVDGYFEEFTMSGTMEMPDELLKVSAEFVVTVKISDDELEGLREFTTGIPLPRYPHDKTVTFYGDLAKTVFNLCQQVLLDYRVS